jgi:L-rhamnose mutarotase
MLRKGFVMSVHPDKVDEYTKRHNPIWPELEGALRDHGAHNYSIFFDPETLLLFGYVEIEDEKRWESIAETEVCQRWWKFMAPLMPSTPSGRPVSHDLKEVFHME